MNARETLAFIQSPEGLCAARDFLSSAQRLEGCIALKQAQADQLRRRRREGLSPGDQMVLDAMEKDVQRDLSSLLCRQKAISDAIRRVPGDVARTVLESHYLQSMPFFRIAMALHYDERQIYRYHRKGLSHIAAQIAAGEIDGFTLGG